MTATLTPLERTLAEVLGLAVAAQGALTTVHRLAVHAAPPLATELNRICAQAAETEEQCHRVIRGLPGDQTLLQEAAGISRQKATTLLTVYLDSQADVLGGIQLLTMTEAREAAHWRVLQRMAEIAANRSVENLCIWAVPIHERHFRAMTDAGEYLASLLPPGHDDAIAPLPVMRQ